MRFINKKRTRKDWVAVSIPWNKVPLAVAWCRRSNQHNRSGWYLSYSTFYFQDPAIASELVLRFG